MNAMQPLDGIEERESQLAAPRAGSAVDEETAAVLHSPHHLAKSRRCKARTILQTRGAAQPLHLSRPRQRSLAWSGAC